MRGSLSYRGSVSSRSGTQEPEAYDTIVQNSLGDYLSVASANAVLHAFFWEGRRFCSPPHPDCRLCPGPPGPDTNIQHWNATIAPRLVAVLITCTTIHLGRLVLETFRALVLTYEVQVILFPRNECRSCNETATFMK